MTKFGRITPLPTGPQRFRQHATATNDKPPVFACNLKAIGASGRPRYNALVKRLRAAIQERQETTTGYAYKIDGSAISLQEAEEWASMERLCCPFLTLQMTPSDRPNSWTLRLSGPDGIKPLLRAEF